jgi:hypothetical protein
MKDFLLLMHNDPTAPSTDDQWSAYLQRLRATGRFQGGSSIGGGVSVRKLGTPAALTHQLGGYIKVTAESLDDARQFLDGNPVYENGGTVEIRELPTEE